MDKLKHLEFIQAVVTRMAANQFQLKGWTVTLIAALFALAAKETKKEYFLIAYLPGLLFWALDGYFLSQERRFRGLYDRVRTNASQTSDFSMDTAALDKSFRLSWMGAVLSRTLILYYGTLIVTMMTVMVIAH